MEKYTGNENNAKIGYSESENINFWERYHVLPRDCETSKLVKDYVESVCVKLFKQKGGEYSQPDFFKKNFDIIVADSDELNAFHLQKNSTKDGKAILCVNKGLFKNVDNEAQLAFVLAHELGHFEVFETKDKDKNGIGVTGHEHEMQADYRGFQSLLQAGYNPDEAIKFFEMIQESPQNVKQAFEAANNEHGTTAARLANIKDYKSAAEVSGVEFSEYTGEKEFKSFQEEFMRKAQNDHYLGYMEERIRQEYNVSSSRELSVKQRWNFCEKIITEEPEVLFTRQRLGEFARIFNENIPSLSKEEANEANRIAQKIYAYEKSIYDGYAEPKGELTSACIAGLPEKDENGNYYIEPFGQIKSDIEYLQGIISNPTETKQKLEWSARNVAHDLEKINLHKDSHFAYPEFPTKDLKVGDKAPWVEIAQAANVTNIQEMERAFRALGVQYNYFEHKYGDSLGYPTGMGNNIYIDAQGIVKSTEPEEVSKLRAESKEKVANLSIDERKRQMKLDFHDQLAMMAQKELGSVEYNAAKQQAVQIYKESGTAFADLDNTYDFLLKVKSSYVISQADNNRPSVQVFNEDLQKNPHGVSINQGHDPKYASAFYPQYAEVVLETELENIRDVYHSSRYPKVEKTMAFVNDLYNNLLDKDNGMDTVSHEVIQKMAPSVFKAYAAEFGDYPGNQAAGYFHRVISQTLLNDHVGADGNLPYVEEFRQKQGFNDAHNTDELVANLEKMKPDEERIINAADEVGYSKLLYDYEVMRTINAGVEIDINRTLNAIPGAVSPDLADKITDYAIEKNLFAAKEGENAEQTYERCKELYITMSAKEAFTQKENMQRQFETKLLNMMQKLPPERRVAEAYDLLSTHADHNKASQQIDNSILSDQTTKEQAQIVAENIKEIGGSILQYDGNRQIAEKIYADSIIQKYGPDDKTPTYRQNMNNELDTMATDISASSRKRICSQVAKGVMAQKELAYDIKDIHDKDVAGNTLKGEAARGYNLIETYMRYHPEFAKKTMDFLLSNGSNTDCEKFSADLAHEYNTQRSDFPPEWQDKLDKKLKDNNIKGVDSRELQKLQIPENSFVAMVSQMHEEYMNADFIKRQAIMHRMLDYYGKDKNAEQSMQKQIDYVSDKIFGTREEDKDLLKEVRAISTAVCHQEEQPTWLLGAVLAGREPGQADEKMNVGDGLTLFCEKKGTAWVKLAQTLSYVDSLPQDIRDSLGRLKDKANEPEQWEIYKDLEEAMPESELARIKKVQKFIGGGTFNKTILIDVENAETGKTETKVVQVMHDKAATKSEREFTKINAAIDELCAQDSKYEILKSVAERSAKNAKIEVDINEGAKQYVNACNSYGAIESVEVNGVSYVPHVATWERYGDSKFSNYKIMEMAPGKSIDSPDFTPQQKHDMALAYTMIEMTNLMSGKAWDIDRHSKQQNFHITQDKDGKPVVEIGIFDTGAQRAAPTKDEKELLGRFLIAVVKEQQKGKDSNLSEFMLEKIKKFEKAGKDVNYVSDVQRGLLAISDVMKHMNTPENPNGMAEGLKTCFAALHKNKLIDNKLYKTLIKETVKAALTSPKFGKSVAEALLQPTESKDNITVNLSKDNTKAQQQIKASVRADKPEHETEAIELEKTRIRPKPKTPREQVEKFLADVNMPKETYLLLTPEDSCLQTTYLNTGRSIEGYFNAQEEAKQKGAKILMGTNNGYTALYFAEQNIYVVSPGYELANKMYYKAGCKDVGYGVMFSNGEKFTNSAFKQDEWENKKAAMKEWRDSGYDKTVLEKYSKGFSQTAFQKAAPAHQLTAAVCKKEDIAFEKISFESLSKSSDMIMLQDYDLSDKNLLAVKNVCCKNCKISAKTELPDYAVLENVSIPKGMDLSRMEKVAFINCEIGDGVKLPPTTHIKDCTVPENIDTSKCLKELKCINCKMDENIALPQGAKLVINDAEKEHPLIIEGMTKKAPEPAKQAEPRVEARVPESTKPQEPKVETKVQESTKQAKSTEDKISKLYKETLAAYKEYDGATAGERDMLYNKLTQNINNALSQMSDDECKQFNSYANNKANEAVKTNKTIYGLKETHLADMIVYSIADSKRDIQPTYWNSPESFENKGAKIQESRVEDRVPESTKPQEPKVETKTPEPAKQTEEKKKTSKPKSAGKTITALRGLGKKTLKEVRKTSLDRSKIKDKSNTK